MSNINPATRGKNVNTAIKSHVHTQCNMQNARKHPLLYDSFSSDIKGFFLQFNNTTLYIVKLLTHLHTGL